MQNKEYGKSECLEITPCLGVKIVLLTVRYGYNNTLFMIGLSQSWKDPKWCCTN